MSGLFAADQSRASLDHAVQLAGQFAQHSLHRRKLLRELVDRLQSRLGRVHRACGGRGLFVEARDQASRRRNHAVQLSVQLTQNALSSGELRYSWLEQMIIGLAHYLVSDLRESAEHSLGRRAVAGVLAGNQTRASFDHAVELARKVAQHTLDRGQLIVQRLGRQLWD